jgi:hypothetical protein
LAGAFAIFERLAKSGKIRIIGGRNFDGVGVA